MLILGLLVAMLLAGAGLAWWRATVRKRRADRREERRRVARRNRNLAHQSLWEQIFPRRRLRRLPNPQPGPRPDSQRDPVSDTRPGSLREPSSDR